MCLANVTDFMRWRLHYNSFDKIKLFFDTVEHVEIFTEIIGITKECIKEFQEMQIELGQQ